MRKRASGRPEERSLTCSDADLRVRPRFVETDRSVTATSIVVMGVSGSGKSTVANLLVERLGWKFAEGDDFHPPANVEKMRSGQPLTDQDRLPWLRAILMTSHGSAVLRQSATNGGLFAYFDKPFDNALMIRTIEEAICIPEPGDDSLPPGGVTRTRFPGRVSSESEVFASPPDPTPDR